MTNTNIQIIGKGNIGDKARQLLEKTLKLRAIKRINRYNGEAVICNGRKPNIILDVCNGKHVGTYFR